MTQAIQNESEMTPPKPNVVELRGKGWRFTAPAAVVIALVGGFSGIAQLVAQASSKIDRLTDAVARLERAQRDAVAAQARVDRAQDARLASHERRLDGE